MASETFSGLSRADLLFLSGFSLMRPLNPKLNPCRKPFNMKWTRELSGYPCNKNSNFSIFTKVFSMITGRGLNTRGKRGIGLESCGCMVFAVNTSMVRFSASIAEVLEVAGGTSPAKTFVVEGIAKS